MIGLSVLVIFPQQKSSLEKTTVDVQENRFETTESQDLFKCSTPWILLGEKCFFLMYDSSQNWSYSLAYCSTKESSLLLIEDKEELELLQNEIRHKGINFWIGLNFTLPEKKFKWINGSFLNSDILQFNGVKKEKDCGFISKTTYSFENCDAENKWICQKALKHHK